MKFEKSLCILSQQKTNAQKIPQDELYHHIGKAAGCVRDIWVMPLGEADLEVCRVVSDLKTEYPELNLKLFFPYARLLEAPRSRRRLDEFLRHADEIEVMHGEFFPNVYMSSVRRLLGDSGGLLALYDGGGGNILFALRCCAAMELPLKVIEV